MLALVLALALQTSVHRPAADTGRARPDTAADSSRARRAQALEVVQVTTIRGGDAAISERTLDRSELQRASSRRSLGRTSSSASRSREAGLRDGLERQAG